MAAPLTATQQTATVYITNNTDGNALIQLYHNNSSNGTQSAAWPAAPGQTVGPLTVNFVTGWGTQGILDYWLVALTVSDGSAPGLYVSSGPLPEAEEEDTEDTEDIEASLPGYPPLISGVSVSWKECQLQTPDAGETLTFSVDTNNFDINLESGGCSASMQLFGPYAPVWNVFVLMLENHSFDNMLSGSGISGILAATANNCNSYSGTSYCVNWQAQSQMPTDPGHEFLDVVQQLTGTNTYPSGGPYPTINNSGFAANYATSTTEGPPSPPPAADIGEIMACFSPSLVPNLCTLASKFAVCDQWFSSIPGPTWPNRFFVHGASSAGLEHSPTKTELAQWKSLGFTYPNGSIYDKMNDVGAPWRLYQDENGPLDGDIPQVSFIKGISQVLDVEDLSDFASDLQNPYLYRYTFIEPNYGDLIGNTYEGGSSQHPMDGVSGGEALISTVYNAIAASPSWTTSILIITYDEHGGFYDYFQPGTAVDPGDGSSDSNNPLNWSGFVFDQLGVRVPAVIVSPLIPPKVDHTVYDHSSVPATLEKLLGGTLGKDHTIGALTNRDAAANDVLHLLSLSPNAARTDCPTSLPPANVTASRRTPPTSADVAARMQEPIPESGNLPAFLAVLLKTELELSSGTPEAQAAIVARFESLKTRGDADAYVKDVMAKVKLAKAVKKARRQRPK